MTSRHESTALARLVGLMLATALVFGVAPAAASVLSAAQGTSSEHVFVSKLDSVSSLDNEPTEYAARNKVPVPAPTESAAEYGKTRAKARAPVPKPVISPASSRTTASGTGSTRTNSANTAANQGTTTPVSSPQPARSTADTLAQARAILNRYIATYPILRGSTVEIGDTRGNPQAIVYYKSGRIVINANHTVSLERIIAHEIWHIIDWRDNGQINWGENVPPSNAADFRG